MGRLMTSFLQSTGRSLDCLLPELSLMPQSLPSGVSDTHPVHHDSTDSAGPLLGMVRLTLVRMFLHPTSPSSVHKTLLKKCIETNCYPDLDLPKFALIHRFTCYLSYELQITQSFCLSSSLNLLFAKTF